MTISNCSGNQGWYIKHSEKGFTCETNYFKLTILSEERQNFKTDKLDPSRAHMVSASNTSRLVPTPENNFSWWSERLPGSFGGPFHASICLCCAQKGSCKAEHCAVPQHLWLHWLCSLCFLSLTLSEACVDSGLSTKSPVLCCPLHMISANLNSEYLQQPIYWQYLHVFYAGAVVILNHEQR